jgi:uncharacterized membrane protein YkgB
MSCSGFINSVKTKIAPYDQQLQTLVSKAVNYLGNQVTSLSVTYDTKFCIPASNFAEKFIGKENKSAVQTIVKVVPIALALLILANPISLTSGFVGYTLVTGLVLVGAPDLFSEPGRAKLCQGAALAGGLYTLKEAAKLVAYGLSGGGLLSFIGGLAFTTALYYTASYTPDNGSKKAAAVERPPAVEMDNVAEENVIN